MANGTHSLARPADAYTAMAQHIAEAILRNEELLVGLDALRALGDEAEAAVEEALEVRSIKIMRLSLALLSELLYDEGYDAVEFLADFIDPELVMTANSALLGLGPWLCCVDCDAD